MASQPEKLVGTRFLSHPQHELIKLVIRKAQSLGLPLYLVGGSVRDILLGIHSQDLDLVVEGDAILLARSLVQDLGGKLTAHTRFQTATIDLKDWRLGSDKSGEKLSHNQIRSVDLISARQESYPSPAVLPKVKPGTILDDLSRRDFTINAMAIRLDNSKIESVLDPHGGQADLIQRKIRVLHPKSFVDDPTRIFRAFRYEQRFNFALSEETLKLLPAGKKYIASLTAKRIRHELDLVLEEPSAAAILERLAKFNLLTAVHPLLRWNHTVATQFDFEVPDDLKNLPGYSLARMRWLIWMLTPTNQQMSSLNSRLHFDASLYGSMISASKLWKQIKHIRITKPSQWVELLEKLPVDAILAVFLAEDKKTTRHALYEYLVSWRLVKPHTTGHQLKELGLKPGRKYSIILGKLRSAWLDGEISSPAQERQYLEKLIR